MSEIFHFILITLMKNMKETIFLRGGKLNYTIIF